MGLFNKKNKEIEIYAPIDGEIIELSKVPDEVFADKMMGDGFAIKPNEKSDGVFVSPISGTLITVFPTGHAYGIKTEKGIEVLLHIGLDTVTLNGEGFDVKVSQDQTINQGEELVKVNLKEVSTKVPSMISPIVFTGDSLEKNKKSFEVVSYGKVKKGDVIAIVK